MPAAHLPSRDGLVVLDRVRCCEAIADARNRFDCKWRFLRGRSKLPELADASVDRIVADRQATPASLDELVLRNDRAARVGKCDKDLHHSPLQRLAGAVPSDLTPRRANAERPQFEVCHLG
jgi:hypothetical protein